MTTSRPIIEIPDEVSARYKNTTPELIIEEGREAAAAAVAGALIAILARSGDLMDSAEIMAMATERVYDTIAQEMGEEHADVWLGYVHHQIRALGPPD